MRTPNLERSKLWPHCLAALIGVLAVAATALAYQLPPNPNAGLFGVAPPVNLSPPQVPLVSRATAARLAQFRELVAAGSWDDAIDILRDVAAGEGERVVAIDDNRYVSLRIFCHLQIARMPAEGLARYRRTVDASAEESYRNAVTRRDEAALGRVMDEWYCSSWGDNALMTLGELALERGDYGAARRYWEQISPLLRDPQGQTTWQALRGVDLNADWPAIARRWMMRSEAPTWLAYPDTQRDLAEVRARLVLVSIRAGELERAALELDVFRRLHPEAVGKLGGQQGPLVAALERLLAAAREWPTTAASSDWSTFGGSAARNAIAPTLGAVTGPAWREPIQLTPVTSPAVQGVATDGIARMVVVRQAQQPLCYFPVAAGGRLFYTDGAGVYAARLADGRPALVADGTIFRTERALGADAQAVGGLAAAPRYTMTIAGGHLYARVGAAATARVQVEQAAIDNWLVGLDLTRDGLLALRLPPDNKEWAFDGAPVSDGRYLYVAMRRSDVNPHAAVACFDPASSRQVWRTSIGSADTPTAGRSNEITHNLLTLVGDRLYFNSNLGLVAALRTSDGAISWLHRYEREAGPISLAGRDAPTYLGRDPSPAIYYEGQLLVAPSDTPNVFALDAETGLRLWSNNELVDAVHLLGVVEDTLVTSGAPLCGIDVRTGRGRYAWPQAPDPARRGLGRGVIAGREVFWPTANEIQVLDVATGRPTRAPIDIKMLGGFVGEFDRGRGVFDCGRKWADDGVGEARPEVGTNSKDSATNQD